MLTFAPQHFKLCLLVKVSDVNTKFDSLLQKHIDCDNIGI